MTYSWYWATHDAFSGGSGYLWDHSIIYFYRNPKFHALCLNTPGHIYVARGLRHLRKGCLGTFNIQQSSRTWPSCLAIEGQCVLYLRSLQGRRPHVRFRNWFLLAVSSLKTNDLSFRPTSPVSFSFCRLFRINLDGLQDIVKHTHYMPSGLHRLASLVRCPRPVSRQS